MNCRLSQLGLVEGWRREGEKRERKVRVKMAGKRRKEERKKGAKRVRGETLVGDVGWREEVVTEGGGDDQNSF